MKLGDFFVELGIKTDNMNIRAIEDNIKALEELEKNVQKEIDLEKELSQALTEEQKARVKKKFALQEEIKAQKQNLSGLKAQAQAMKDVIKGAVGIAMAVAGAVIAVDRMATSLVRSNQRLINFQRTTGISLGTLQKYAQANVAVNPLASIEGTAGSLSNLANNLWDIRMGRGDVSAFQELSYFSGQQVEPFGSPEKVIEQVRSALRSIPNDVQATNLIQRMGFNADDLMMLRMTREEFEKTQQLFLKPEQQEQLAKYGKELNLLHLNFKLIGDRMLLDLLPVIIDIEEAILPLFKEVANFLKPLSKMVGMVTKTVSNMQQVPQVIATIKMAILGLITAINPLIGGLTLLYLILEDIFVYFTGGDSVLGDLLNYFDELGKKLEATELVKFFKTVGDSIKQNFTGGAVENLAKIIGGLTNLQMLMSGNPLALTNGMVTNFLTGQGGASNVTNNSVTDGRNVAIHVANPQQASDILKMGMGFDTVSAYNMVKGGTR